jgi:membrane associated rhomboid family serine protease
MSEQQPPDQVSGAPGRQPIFLLPAVVTALIGMMVAIYLAETFVLNDEGRLELLYQFAFLPQRILAMGEDINLGLPLLWTPFSHAFLHDGWEHLLVNMAWLMIFATPVARRYGAGPTIALFLISAAAGAFAFAATTLNSGAFLIGASGGVSGLTGAAIRFMFQPVLYTEIPETGERIILGRRLLSLRQLFRDPRARNFTLIWVLLNAAVPLLPLLTGGGTVYVAWEAHLGGFAAGLLLVGLFEKRTSRT